MTARPQDRHLECPEEQSVKGVLPTGNERGPRHGRRTLNSVAAGGSRAEEGNAPNSQSLGTLAVALSVEETGSPCWDANFCRLEKGPRVTASRSVSSTLASLPHTPWHIPAGRAFPPEFRDLCGPSSISGVRQQHSQLRQRCRSSSRREYK